MLGRRLVELFFAVVLIGVCVQAIRTGEYRGGWRSYSRTDDPFSFWSGVVITLAIGLCFLFGFTSWRQ
jgi:hypothetical protein